MNMLKDNEMDLCNDNALVVYFVFMYMHNKRALFWTFILYNIEIILKRV